MYRGEIVDTGWDAKDATRENWAYEWPGSRNSLRARKNVKREPNGLPFFYPKEQRQHLRLYSCKIIKYTEEKECPN